MSRRSGTDLQFATHATTIGAITAIAIAAIDTALWDLKAKKQGLPLWKLAGGAKARCPLYTTEGGWLHIETQALVDDALSARAQGFRGAKIKIGRPHVSEDFERLSAVRNAVGDGFEIMADANQGFTVGEAIRRAATTSRSTSPGSRNRCRPKTSTDISASPRRPRCRSRSANSSIDPSHFREYLQRDACAIVQADVARIGGITPWLKVAHLAETFNVPICPHFLMELHVSLCAAVPNAAWVEWIPQLDDITTSRLDNRRRAGETVVRTRSRHRLGLAGDRETAGLHAGRAERVTVILTGARRLRSARPSDQNWHRPPALA